MRRNNSRLLFLTFVALLNLLILLSNVHAQIQTVDINFIPMSPPTHSISLDRDATGQPREIFVSGLTQTTQMNDPAAAPSYRFWVGSVPSQVLKGTILSYGLYANILSANGSSQDFLIMAGADPGSFRISPPAALHEFALFADVEYGKGVIHRIWYHEQGHNFRCESVFLNATVNPTASGTIEHYPPPNSPVYFGRP